MERRRGKNKQPEKKVILWEGGFWEKRSSVKRKVFLLSLEKKSENFREAGENEG
jgi:hypothetical protein